MAPEITVLLPVYNGQRYIAKAVDSVLSQTFGNFELLIVDDGSTDDTARIIRAFGDTRIRMVRNERRLKLSGALNRGFDLARGRYIARMDADDICLPKRLAVQSAFLDRHPEIGICGAHTQIFGMKKWEIHRAPVGKENVRAHMFFDNPFVHPAVMLRKSLFDKHGLRYNGDYYPTEDYELWSRALRYFPGDNVDRVLLRYRLHPASMTRSDWNNMDEKATRIVGSLLNRAGLNVEKEELVFHRTIGREMSCICSRRRDILRGERWLRNLREVNRKKRFADPAAFDAACGDAWFRLCFNSSVLGAWVIRRYADSPLVRNQRRRSLRTLLIYLSFLKRAALRQRGGAAAP